MNAEKSYALARHEQKIYKITRIQIVAIDTERSDCRLHCGSPSKSSGKGSCETRKNHRSEMPNDNVSRILNRAVERQNGYPTPAGEESHGCACRDRRGKQSLSKKDEEQAAADQRTNRS
jgi:hypothetical protein